MTTITSELNDDIWAEKLNLVHNPENFDPITERRPFYVGKEALALGKHE